MNAQRFHELAEKLERDAADRHRSRLDNTPKRALQAACARIEGNHCQRAARALRALAACHESGTVPKLLAGVKTKAQALEMTKTRVEHPSYYVVRDTGEYFDTSEAAKALRALADGRADPIVEAERVKRQAIAEMEAKVRFTPIAGFYPTPPALVARLLELAEVEPTHKVLEPSAGKGDIAEAVRAVGAEVLTCEIVPCLCDILTAKGFPVVSGDFIERFSLRDPVDLIGYVSASMQQFDRVVMNPPFENLTDLAHIRHAYKLLRKGGRLVSVMSPSGWFRQCKKAQEFRDWFACVDGQTYDVPPGQFLNGFAPTGVECRIVVINN